MPTTLTRIALLAVVAVGAVLAFGSLRVWSQASDQTTIPSVSKSLPLVPQGKDNDLKLYEPDGRIVKGREAMQRMSQADLVLWLAGNQFFAMDEVIGSFQRQHPGKSVGLMTLPPGLLLRAIKAGGWFYGGRDFMGRPDVYASVNLGHLQDLKLAGLTDTYIVYMHNELQLMVARGSPKKVSEIDDLARPDVRTSMPNPVNEGSMQFYGHNVLERHGLWDRIAAGKECVSCETTPNNWFTAVRHRETPERIRDGKSDVGIVWKTEVLEALRDGAPVDAVELPAEDSLRNELSYVAGVLRNSPHHEAAGAFMRVLASSEGQDAYAKFGFVKASSDELKLKALP